MINQEQLLSLARWAATSAAMWAVGKGYVSADNVPLVVGAVVSLSMLCWGLFVHTPANTVKAAAATPGVTKIVMDSQASADAIAPKDAVGVPQPDKILSPSEDLSHVANDPGVVAVVMKSSSAAEANPSPKVIGPIAAVPEPKP